MKTSQTPLPTESLVVDSEVASEAVMLVSALELESASGSAASETLLADNDEQANNETAPMTDASDVATAEDQGEPSVTGTESLSSSSESENNNDNDNDNADEHDNYNELENENVAEKEASPKNNVESLLPTAHVPDEQAAGEIIDAAAVSAQVAASAQVILHEHDGQQVKEEEVLQKKEEVTDAAADTVVKEIEKGVEERDEEQEVEVEVEGHLEEVDEQSDDDDDGEVDDDEEDNEEDDNEEDDDDDLDDDEVKTVTFAPLLIVNQSLTTTLFNYMGIGPVCTCLTYLLFHHDPQTTPNMQKRLMRKRLFSTKERRAAIEAILFPLAVRLPGPMNSNSSNNNVKKVKEYQHDKPAEETNQEGYIPEVHAFNSDFGGRGEEDARRCTPSTPADNNSFGGVSELTGAKAECPICFVPPDSKSPAKKDSNNNNSSTNEPHFHCPNCTQFLHSDCVVNWLEHLHHQKCPCCREEMISESLIKKTVNKARLDLGLRNNNNNTSNNRKKNNDANNQQSKAVPLWEIDDLSKRDDDDDQPGGLLLGNTDEIVFQDKESRCAKSVYSEITDSYMTESPEDETELIAFRC